MTRPTFQEFKNEALSDPEVKAEYESLSLVDDNSKNAPERSTIEGDARVATYNMKISFEPQLV